MTGPAPDPLIGQTLGGFRLITELGSGGMGTVYYGEHMVIGRRAAIKVLRPEVARDEDIVARFLVEARAVNDIRHPNVVPITDMGREGDLWFIVMDLLEGETLGERMERTPQLDGRGAVRILRQVAGALAAAHERGIVHRDLKPENIFLTNHPDYPDHVKLLDFGIAKLIAPSGPGSLGGSGLKTGGGATQAGVLLGTPTYMSPEQCRGDVELDGRSDIYSLGIVLYEMLAGRPPFVSESLGALLVAHSMESPRPPSQLNPDIPAALEAVVLRALEKDPAKRFPDMRAMRQALDESVAAAPAPRNMAPSPRAPLPAAPPSTPAAKAKIEAERVEAEHVVTRLTTIILDRVKSDRLALPAMPGIALECMTAIRDPQQTFASVATLAARDPLLAARILRLANSAAFPSRMAATNLEQAVARMGIEGLTIALVEFSLEDVFSSRDDRIRQAFGGIWEHSVATALLAKDLTQTVAGAGGEGASAYLGGLLHDIGKPVVASMLLEAERIVEAEGQMRWLSAAVWKRVVDASHRAVGCALAEKWKLPDAIAAAVRSGSEYDLLDRRSTGNFVRLANALAKREGLYVGETDPLALAETLATGRLLLGIEAAVLDRACQNLRSRVGTLVDPSGAVRNRTTRPGKKRAGALA